MIDSSVKILAIKLRKEGFSFSEIAEKTSIAKGTAYEWTKNVALGSRAINILSKKTKLALVKANAELKSRRQLQMSKIFDTVINDQNNLSYNQELYKLACGLLFWCEGSKNKSRVSFINSDPDMIKTFLTLLRKSFQIDESKFRALIHIHEYHNKKEIESFWSIATNIPLNQFNKSYLKPNTGKNKHKDYKGCCNIRYYDSKIAHELTIIYNCFTRRLIE